MAMSHKAFAFDWNAFEGSLKPVLESALDADAPVQLHAFLMENWKHLKDPYEGQPLEVDCREILEGGDVHELGDYALTRFYDPTDDCGIGEVWSRLSDHLPDAAANALLGFPLGSPQRPFDPGRCGSYFQTSSQAGDSLAILAQIDQPALTPFLELLMRCKDEHHGVYVTF